MPRVQTLTALLVIAAAASGLAPARAETLPPEDVRVLVEHGDVLPLAEVLRRLDPAVDGEIIGVALDREGSRYLYKIKVLGLNGRYREYRADAKTGTSAPEQ
jgi:uncharacterized membrane protein YkoI